MLLIQTKHIVCWVKGSSGQEMAQSERKSHYKTEIGWQSDSNRHFSLLNVNAAGACGYDFLCDGGRLVRAYVRLRRGAI